jgi:peptide deformylase
MVKDIVKDTDFLSKKCNIASWKKDQDIITDLIDTAEQYRDTCLGLASNQIGYNKRIVVIKNGSSWRVMINPVIRRHSRNMHESHEGCLSLEGIRDVMRYDWVEVTYQDQKGKMHTDCFVNEYTNTRYSDVSQHEIGHLDGQLI